MNRKIKGTGLIAIGLGFIYAGMLQFMPQMSEPGYVKLNTVTGEVSSTTGNGFKEFTSQYVGSEMIEKDKVYSLIAPVGYEAKVQKVEVNVDGSIFACAPKDPGQQPPPPAPTPIPQPPPTTKGSWGIT